MGLKSPPPVVLGRTPQRVARCVEGAWSPRRKEHRQVNGGGARGRAEKGRQRGSEESRSLTSNAGGLERRDYVRSLQEAACKLWSGSLPLGTNPEIRGWGSLAMAHHQGRGTHEQIRGRA